MEDKKGDGETNYEWPGGKYLILNIKTSSRFVVSRRDEDKTWDLSDREGYIKYRVNKHEGTFLNRIFSICYSSPKNPRKWNDGSIVSRLKCRIDKELR